MLGLPNLVRRELGKNDSSTADENGDLPRVGDGKSNLQYRFFLSVDVLHPDTMAPTVQKKSDPTPATLGGKVGSHGGSDGAGPSSGVRQDFDAEKWELENVHE